MTLVAEKIVVTALEFLETRNINDSHDFNDPLFKTKMNEYGWDLSFSAASIVCELIWKIAVPGGGMSEYRQLDRLFSPSPVATHCNFRGCPEYKTGNLPEVGAIAVYKKGNGWKGTMLIVVKVSEDKKSFDGIEGRVLEGSDEKFLTLEMKNRVVGLPFKTDKMNLIGFIYPPNREIS